MDMVYTNEEQHRQTAQSRTKGGDTMTAEEKEYKLRTTLPN